MTLQFWVRSESTMIWLTAYAAWTCPIWRHYASHHTRWWRTCRYPAVSRGDVTGSHGSCLASYLLGRYCYRCWDHDCCLRTRTAISVILVISWRYDCWCCLCPVLIICGFPGFCDSLQHVSIKNHDLPFFIIISVSALTIGADLWENQSKEVLQQSSRNLLTSTFQCYAYRRRGLSKPPLLELAQQTCLFNDVNYYLFFNH